MTFESEIEREYRKARIEYLRVKVEYLRWRMTR